MSTLSDRYGHSIDQIKAHKIGKIGTDLYAYTTAGGTYVLTSNARWNDDGQPHDLVAILPMALENGTRVIPLRPTVNPDLLSALREALDEKE